MSEKRQPVFRAQAAIATVANPEGDLACRVESNLYWPDIVETKKGKERSSLPIARLRAARLLCVQCVRFDECFSTDMPNSKYGVVAGVNTGTTSNRQAPHKRDTLELRDQYLESIRPAPIADVMEEAVPEVEAEPL